ncbi:hypothetical protein [Teichococcus oryzae]|uniref:Uncharacterized protein n=1 Tax=Teichococcus oryzae TaxID=1608942 RepID=A0A5B2TA27_9PROT|nr:hypothetical protein [Pseudoroseomonas oryzae]KAA2211422.1 hypothetical protein F0Q34_20190 [Pseudoroseomonas oryzae]
MARATVRLRRVRTVVAQNPDLVVRIGGRLYVLEQETKLRALAAALGLMLPSAVKPSRAQRAALSSNAVAT